MKTLFRAIICVFGFLTCQLSSGEILDRPGGLKIGERLTLRPYVTMSVSYDSNVDSNRGRTTGGSDADVLWAISPALWLHYNAETWSTILSGFYNYRHYSKSCHRACDHHTYGEDLRFNWANSTGAEKGWSLVIGQSFQQITASDELLVGDREYDSNARQFQFAGSLQRRFNEHWHGDVNGSYYWLDYDNDVRSSSAFYGWNRWLLGAEMGFAPSKWTDLIVSGSYQGYEQDNLSGSVYSGDSSGCSLQAGLGSYMTERISYRLLAGWSRFEYADGLSTSDGFVYTATANWKIGETWNTMLLASSYYQPSERQYASQARVDAVSWGLAKLMVRGKLRATLDVRFRREDHSYAGDDTRQDWDYVLNIWTGRVGVDYSLNRFLSAFAYAEYQKSMNDQSEERHGAYDYDRWRVTGGIKLSY